MLPGMMLRVRLHLVRLAGIPMAPVANDLEFEKGGVALVLDAAEHQSFKVVTKSTAACLRDLSCWRRRLSHCRGFDHSITSWQAVYE